MPFSKQNPTLAFVKKRNAAKLLLILCLFLSLTYEKARGKKLHFIV